MRFESIGMRCVDLGIRFESIGMRFVDLGTRYVDLGMRFESIGMKPTYVGSMLYFQVLTAPSLAHHTLTCHTLTHATHSQ